MPTTELARLEAQRIELEQMRLRGEKQDRILDTCTRVIIGLGVVLVADIVFMVWNAAH